MFTDGSCCVEHQCAVVGLSVLGEQVKLGEGASTSTTTAAKIAAVEGGVSIFEEKERRVS